MSSQDPVAVFCCNGAPVPTGGGRHLDYRPQSPGQNVTVGLPAFVRNVYHIPHRVLDLLEIAAYVFSADRLTARGRSNEVEFQRWARRFHFRIRVRDHQFWSTDEARMALRDALCFVSGDADYSFDFLAGHSTPPTSLFDREDLSVPKSKRPPAVLLFSGGLDSLAGSLDLLANAEERAILVSHQSQTGTTRTQQQLVAALRERFGAARIAHYPFQCRLKGLRAAEETQRTRSFLYASIGFAIALAYRETSLSICENGVTSLNLRRREDLANARASRTTHPQTVARLSQLFSLVSNKAFAIKTPLLLCTKADVVQRISQSGHGSLIASAVSCSRTFQRMGLATHCGKCFQCVDRRMAMHATSLEKLDDSGLYSTDMIASEINDPEARTIVVDYVRQALGMSQDNVDHFESEYLTELAAIIEYVPGGGSEFDRVEKIWSLLKRHGQSVAAALRRMRDLYDDPARPLPSHSLLGLLATREHLKPEVTRAVDSICAVVENAVGPMFSRGRPSDEPDLNAKLGALIKSHEPRLVSEHPTVSFACARVIPDHEVKGQDLLIEAKYLRKGTPPSKASEGIAADLTKYPDGAHILFFVYDPDAAIADKQEFSRSFEEKGRCTIRVLR